MNNGLIGYTGFVGGNLARQHHFTQLYNSRNIASIAGQSFDLLVVSAMPAAMWIANREPEKDAAILDQLTQSIASTAARHVLLISTVAVYPDARGADETTAIDTAMQTPYGRHRHMLECRLRSQFPSITIVRLPALFGPGLKKNAIYDLMHNNDIHKLHAQSRYQFYNLNSLWADAQIAMESKSPVVNFATEPTTLQEIAHDVFGMDFTNDPGTAPADYDMKTVHAARFGGSNGYIRNRQTVLNDLKQFVMNTRGPT